MFAQVFFHVLLFTLLAIPGFVLGKIRLMDEKSVPTLTNILMNVAMPALVLKALCSLKPGDLGLFQILLCVLFPVLTEFLLVLLCAFAFRGVKDRKKAAVCKFCSVFSNCGFLGIPLAAAMFPEEPRVTVMVSLFNVFSTLMLWTVGVWILTEDKSAVSPQKAICNPLTLSILLGALCAAFSAGERFPILGEYITPLSQLTTPLSMIVLGYELSRLSLRGSLRDGKVYLTLFFKLIALPALTAGILYLLKLFGLPVNAHLFSAMFFSTAVSTAVTAPALSEKYGADGSYASLLTLSSAVGCVLTVPSLYSLIYPLFCR